MKKIHIVDILIVIVIAILVLTSIAVVTAEPRKEKVLPNCVANDCLVSTDMAKFLGYEGHGKVFDEGDMQ